MAWRPHGRAQVNPARPQAFGVCDRCGFLHNLARLQWQYEWAGNNIVNKRMLVCDPCRDKPQEQRRTILIPVDPPPVMNARVERYDIDEAGSTPFPGDPGVQVPPPPPVYVPPPIVPGSLKFNSAVNSGLLTLGI